MILQRGIAVADQATNVRFPERSLTKSERRTAASPIALVDRRLERDCRSLNAHKASDQMAVDELAYLDRRYGEEMRAGEEAQPAGAKTAHFELAYRYAVRARDLRASLQL